MTDLSRWIEHTLEASVFCIVDYKCVCVKKPERDDPTSALNLGARS